MADETTFPGMVSRGMRGRVVRLVQEWLSLHDWHVKVDGDFGPATEMAVVSLQAHHGLPVTGTVDSTTFDLLVEPMRRARAALVPASRSLGELVVIAAEQHLAEHPREIGGPNSGPWVRLYMNGRQGQEWPWCAGFACYCLTQACEALKVPLPIVRSVSCDALASSAKERDRFLRLPGIAGRTEIGVGSLFLSRRTPTDWAHTGIVVQAHSEAFSTVEGNTNDEGSREGYEVCARTRGYRNMDFIVWR